MVTGNNHTRGCLPHWAHSLLDCLQDGYTPLHRAAINGHAEVAKLLLERGAALEAKDNVGGLCAGNLWTQDMGR